MKQLGIIVDSIVVDDCLFPSSLYFSLNSRIVSYRLFHVTIICDSIVMICKKICIHLLSVSADSVWCWSVLMYRGSRYSFGHRLLIFFFFFFTFFPLCRTVCVYFFFRCCLNSFVRYLSLSLCVPTILLFSFTCNTSMLCLFNIMFFFFLLLLLFNAKR